MFLCHAALLPSNGPQGLLEILSTASEYDDVPVRPGEERLVQVRQAARHMGSTLGDRAAQAF